jgi:hypothetical protein
LHFLFKLIDGRVCGTLRQAQGRQDWVRIGFVLPECEKAIIFVFHYISWSYAYLGV